MNIKKAIIASGLMIVGVAYLAGAIYYKVPMGVMVAAVFCAAGALLFDETNPANYEF